MVIGLTQNEVKQGKDEIMRLLVFFVLIGALSGNLHAQVIQNGDVNGDSSRDIGDVVYLLSHLFQSGPAPVPIPMRLPLMDAASAGARYINNGDGTWTDSWTSLVWITGAYYWQVWDGYDSPDEYFNDIEYAGFSDWRLPYPDEVMSLYPWGTPLLYQCQGLVFDDSYLSQAPIWGEWINLLTSPLPQGAWPYGSMRITVNYPDSIDMGVCVGGDRHIEWEAYLTSSSGNGPVLSTQGRWNSYFSQPAGIAVRELD
jgi:hypothetical protein